MIPKALFCKNFLFPKTIPPGIASNRCNRDLQEENDQQQKEGGCGLNSSEFSERVLAIEAALYRVAYGLLLNRTDCADAVQETLLRGWEKRHTLRDSRYFQTWLIRILINECYSMLRRRKKVIPLDEVPEPAAPPDADRTLHDAIARLDRKLRLPVVLHYMEGYSVGEVAELLRLPAGTVKTRLFKARKILRLQLIDENEGRKS